MLFASTFEWQIIFCLPVVEIRFVFVPALHCALFWCVLHVVAYAVLCFVMQ